MQPTDQQRLYSTIDAYERVGNRLAEAPNSVFVSSWDSDHPFVGQFMGQIGNRPIVDLGDPRKYSRVSFDIALRSAIRDLHVSRYGEAPFALSQCVPAAGAGGLLASLLVLHNLQGVNEFAYIPPMYQAAAWWIRALGWNVYRAATEIDLVSGRRLRLPDRRMLLWITDPLWFAGVSVQEETIHRIAAWQRATGSTVIVDGTFQYMQWSDERSEATSQLDPELTFRLICPTKALALHGMRFAYVIAPPRQASKFAEIQERMHGASGIVDLAFAHRAVEVLASSSSIHDLMSFVQHRYRTVVNQGVLSANVEPTCGYFLFAKAIAPSSNVVGLGADCYDTMEFNDYLRYNLLNSDAVRALGIQSVVNTPDL